VIPLRTLKVKVASQVRAFFFIFLFFIDEIDYEAICKVKYSLIKKGLLISTK
jgi:hypothetical protein